MHEPLSIQMHNERHAIYCGTCGGSGIIRVAVTGSKLDFERCPTCRGTGRPSKFKSKKNREIFEL